MLPSNSTRFEAVNTCLQRSSSNAESLSTYAKHKSTASSKKRKSHLEPSVLLRAQSENISTLKGSRLRPHAREPTFLRSRSSVYPKKTQCFVQILTFKSHPWCIKTKLSCDASVNFQMPFTSICDSQLQNAIVLRVNSCHVDSLFLIWFCTKLMHLGGVRL